MAEGSIPRKKAQIAVIPATKCELCEIYDIQFKCFTCEEYTYMCNICKIAHKKGKATRDHKITPTKGADQREDDETAGTDVHKCRSHPSEDIVLFCKECRYPVCTECITSGAHKNHNLVKIHDMIDEKQKELSKIIDEASKKLSVSKDKIKSIRKMGDKYSKDVRKCIEQVKAWNEQLKSMLNQITSEVIDKLQREEKQILDVLKREDTKMAANEIPKLKEIIKCCQEQQKKRDIELVRFVTDVKNKLDKLQLSDPPRQPSPPVFVTKDIDIQKLRILFGDIDPEKSSNFEKSPEVIPPITKPSIDVKIMSTFTMKSKDLVAAVSDTQAWVCNCGYGDLSLITSDGKVIQTVKIDFSINDMAVTTTGELLVTVLFGYKVKKMTSNSTFIDVYVAPVGYRTQGITVTDDNHIIVSLSDRNEQNSKLLELSCTGDLLNTIQYESTDDKTPLFDDVWCVSSNRNKDLIVADPSRHNVVIVDRTGHKKCTYTGDIQGLKESFCPWYTVTDKYGHILISDRTNNVIHLLDSEGKFLQFVLTQKHQLKGPHGMSIDKSGRLWVYSWGNRKIMVTKYV